MLLENYFHIIVNVILHIILKNVVGASMIVLDVSFSKN